MKIAVMERTLECVFRNLMEYFGDKIDLLDYLEEEVRNPPHTYIAGLKEQIDGLKEANSQLEIQAIFLQFSINELCEEATPFQVYNVWLFDEYRDLKIRL